MNTQNLFPLQPVEIYDEIRTMTRKFADSVTRPVAGELDRNEIFPEDIFRRMSGQGLRAMSIFIVGLNAPGVANNPKETKMSQEYWDGKSLNCIHLYYRLGGVLSGR